MDEDDTFTQRILENLQKRSKTLGISNISKVPLTEMNAEPKQTPSKQKSLMKSLPKRRSSADRKPTPSPTSNNKIVARTSDRSFNIDSKENVDLALEINITTGPNVQVQVEVEEQEIDGDGNVLSTTHSKRRQITAYEDERAPSACIRDSSRNRLQRLGALYSDTENLSSPIHRTESNFDVEDDRKSRATGPKLKPRFAKLTELANSINTWEDESTQKDATEDKAQTNNVVASASTKSNEAKIVNMCPRKADSPRKTERNDTKSILSRNNPETKNTSDPNKIDKQLKWDKTVMDALESQGFKRRDTTNSRLEYDFKASNGNLNRDPATKPNDKSTSGASTSIASKLQPVKQTVEQPAKRNELPKRVEGTKGLVSGRTAIFENPNRLKNTSNIKQKDPAEMSLKERLALFEKNKGTALIPKAALGMAPSTKQIMADKKYETVKPVITTPQQPMVNNSTTSASKINSYNKPTMTDSNASGMGIRQTVAALLSNPVTISESQIALDVRKTREQEMNILLNRFNRKENKIDEIQPSAPPMTPPPAPPMPSNLLTNSNKSSKANQKRRSDEKIDISPQVRNSLEDIKRVKVNPPKNGQMYPALSDIESVTESDKYATDAYTDEDNEQQLMNRYLYSSQDDEEDVSYMDSEEAESIISNNYDKRTSNGAAKHVQYLDSSTASSGNELDDYLNEALEDDSDDDDDDYTRNDKTKKYKGSSISSNSFCFEKKPIARHQTIQEEEQMVQDKLNTNYSSPIKSKLTVNPSNDSVTLTHTVSFYRRQQSQSVNSTPVKTFLHANYTDDISSTEDNNDDDSRNHENDKHLRTQRDLVDRKIKSLLDNVAIQQQQIAQASNALNTCASTFEFSGSTESVVAEWKLLVATHSRQAALNEVTRLRVERCLRPADAPRECGHLTIKEITVPLKQDYFSKIATDKITGHHLVCLLKYNEQVLATKTIPTLPGLLSVQFPDVIQLNNVYADFKVTLEIYGMMAQREVVPHDIKYHIKNKKGGIKTPKGKKAESRLIMPPIQSPAGPNAVRTPSFAHYGFIIFSLREAQRTNWQLNQVSGVSPLIGTVHMKVNCALSVNIDYKGFLTMFEDVSGFGAWHRRWCRLHGNVLSYWKYPDDERKPPIGSLDLSACEQQKITTAPRDVCARLNTFLLELKRPRQDDDHDSLVIVKKQDHTIVRHLLSADTKEERNEWCAHFNKALALMRAWGVQR